MWSQGTLSLWSRQPGLKVRDRKVALAWVVPVAGEPPHRLPCCSLPRVSQSPPTPRPPLLPRGCEFGPRLHGNQCQAAA